MAARRHRALPRAESEGKEVRVTARAATRLRAPVWLAQLVLPLLGLWLLRANPRLDARWEHHAGHFWIVAVTALVSVVLGVWVSEAARSRGDARLLLVSLAFLSAAGFLLLHALATPAVLLPGGNTGFTVATPFGLFLGAWFAFASSTDLTPARAAAVLRRQWLLRGGLALVMAVWAALSLLALPPFDAPMAEDASHQLVHGLAVVGIALYALAAVRYARMLWRRRVMLGIVTSYVLLAETLTTMFVTCVYAVLDPTTGRLRWANAGQDLPLLRSGAEVAELRATGMPLGLMPNMRYQEQVTLVPRGGSLLFHSDGLTEAHGPGREMFGGGRIAALAARQLDGEALIRLLLDELHQFTGPDWEQEDDITLVALERSAAGVDAGRPAEPGRLAEATAEARSIPIRRGRPATAVAEAVERGGSG